MDGKDKADAFVGDECNRGSKNRRRSAQLLLGPKNELGMSHLWHLSDRNAPAGNPDKHMIQTGEGGAIDSPIRRPERLAFAIPPRPDIMLELQNCRSFLNIYDPVRASSEPVAEGCPGPGWKP
jgi:hypothetical protein